jgi:thioredoxin-like negative regulator of GroEL
MLERAAVLLGIALLVMAVTVAVRRWWAVRLERLKASADGPVWSALGEKPDGRPAVVVFSAPGCAACRTTQEPAVEAVASRFGEAVRVMHVDIASRPSVSRAFGVLTAPSTAVLDRDGRIGSVNQGFAPAAQLAAQLNELGVLRSSAG